MHYKILIVEDEAKLRTVLGDYFASKQDTAIAAENGLQALSCLEEQDFDAVLLDIMMPELDGFSVCRAARKVSDVPIIFLTALSDEEDKLYGYELGADDYITKPFSLSVLYAKVTALIKRRRGNMLSGDYLEAGTLSVHLPSRRVFAGKKEILLTPKEYALLICLMQHKGLVMSREQLWETFYRADPARSSKGTGLGLAIAKNIISLHGGTCAAENTPLGVAFSFTI